MAILLVHYGDPAVTNACLRSLTPQAKDALVVVSNNGNPEQADRLEMALRATCGTCVRLRPGESYPSGVPAVLIHNGGNRGFAAGCNTGLRLILAEPTITHVWLLNNDTRPLPGALDALLKTAADRPQAIIGATILRARDPGRLQLAGGLRYFPATSRILPAYAGAAQAEVPSLPEPPLDYVYGASMCIPTALLSEIGLLDEGYFLFYEELDFCYRARTHSVELAWCRDCQVIHEESAAVGQPGGADTARATVAAYHEARSTLRFTRRHHFALLPTVLAARLLVKPLLLAARGHWPYIPAAVRGVLDGLLGRFAPPD